MYDSQPQIGGFSTGRIRRAQWCVYNNRKPVQQISLNQTKMRLLFFKRPGLGEGNWE